MPERARAGDACPRSSLTPQISSWRRNYGISLPPLAEWPALGRFGRSLCRWTNGNALLPLVEDTHLLELWLADAMAYPEDAAEVASRAA